MKSDGPNYGSVTGLKALPACPYTHLFDEKEPVLEGGLLKGVVVILVVVIDLVLMIPATVLFLIDCLSMILINEVVTPYVFGPLFNTNCLFITMHHYIADFMWRHILGRPLFYGKPLAEHAPPDESPSVKAKADALWGRIMMDEGKPATLTMGDAGIRALMSSASTTLKWRSDVHVPGHKKMIHGGEGRVARAKIEWNSEASSRYSGLFKGSSEVVMRASMGGVIGNSMGMAVKGLRTGVPSGNFFLLWSFFKDPDTPNFLDWPMSTHIPSLARKCNAAGPATISMRTAMCKLFSSPMLTLGKFIAGFRVLDVTPKIPERCCPAMAIDQLRTGTFTGLSDWASHDEKGMAAESTEFPFALVFRPDPTLRNKMDAKAQESGPLASLDGLADGDSPWTVWAVPTLDPGSAFEAGKVVLASSFVKSAFADDRLHFFHTFFADDCKVDDKYMQWAEDLTTARSHLESAAWYEEEWAAKKEP